MSRTAYLPVPWTRWLRPLAQWPPISLRPPQTTVEVRFVCGRSHVDVTRSAVVASLRPLTLALHREPASGDPIDAAAQPVLRLIDIDSGRTLGELDLLQVRTWTPTAGVALALFEVTGGRHWCLSWPYRPWNRWLQNRRMSRQTDPNNFLMSPAAVQQQMIFYICPRPVGLVSVEDGSHSNLFPMDLIGPVTNDHFTLALRATSPSIPTMKGSGHVVLSDVPASLFRTAYQLGIHHKQAQVDWDELPFEIRRTPVLSLPYPAVALRVRELAILDFAAVGSHILFLTRVISDRSVVDAPQFFHTSGIYAHFRSRRSRPFLPCK